MSYVRIVRLTAAAIAVVLAGSLGAQAAGSTMWGSGHFLHEIDRDRNGVVSKEEFSQFMDRTFKRLDTNRNGTLEPSELRPLFRGRWERIHAPHR
jgi:hypothetical protein